jgi:pilus assembly protein Flp/PilA
VSGGYFLGEEVLKVLKRLFKGEEGQGMVEYGLIIALVAIVVIVVLTAMGGKLKDTFNNITNAVPSGT